MKLKYGQHFAADACRCIKKGKVSQKACGGERGKTKDKEEQRTCVVFSLGTSLTRLMSTLIYNAHIHLPPSGHWLRAHLGWIPLLRCFRRTLTRINGKMFPSIVARSNLFLFHASCFLSQNLLRNHLLSCPPLSPTLYLQFSKCCVTLLCLHIWRHLQSI